MKTGFAFLLFISCVGLCRAQYPHYRTFSEKDGLPDAVIYTPFQDSKGYIWLPSSQGVARYNGQRFQKFTTSQGVLKNETLGLFEDPYGRIFFEPAFNDEMRLQYFDTKTERLHTLALPRQQVFYKNTIKSLSLASTRIKYKQLDSSTIMVSLAHYTDPRDHYFCAFLHCSANGISVESLPNTLLQLPKSTLINGDMALSQSVDHPAIWRFKNRQWQPFAHIPQKFVTEVDLDKVLILSDSTFAFANNQEISICNRHGKRLATYPLQTKLLIEFHQVKNLFVALTHEGNYFFLDHNLRPLSFGAFLNTLPLKSIFVDRQHNWWIVTTTDKVILLSDKALTQTRSWSMGEVVRHCIRDSRGRIWIGTNSGKVLYKTDSESAWHPVTFDPPFIDYIRGITCTEFGNLLIGNNKQLAIIDVDKPTLPTHFSLQYERFFSQTLPFTLPRRSNVAILGAFKAISSEPTLLIAEGSRTWQATPGSTHTSFEWVAIGKSYASVTHKGFLYLGRPDGVFRLPIGSRKEPTRIGSIPATSIGQLAINANGQLYVAPEEGGLYVVDTKTLAAKPISFLGNSIVNRVVIDSSNNAWVCSQQRGLIKLANHRPTAYWGLAEGLSSANVFDVLIKNNRLTVATAEGITEIQLRSYLSPDRNTQQRHGLQFKSVTFTNGRQDSVQLYPNLTAPLQLKSNQNSLRFMVENLDFLSPATMSYQFILLKNADTLQTRTQPELTYETRYLDAGHYWLLVRDEYGQSITFRFEIMRPIWQQWWFWVLMLLMAGAVVYYQLQIRIRRASLELRALQGQMNAHFAANFMEVVKNLVIHEDRIKAFNSLSLFGRLMRSFVVASRNKQIRIQDEVEFLKNYIQLSKLVYYLHQTDKADKTLTDLVVIASGVDPQAYIKPLLVQPFVENAIKYGIFHKEAASRLLVRFEPYRKHSVRCLIEDDGVGRKRVAEIQAEEKQNLLELGLKISNPKGSIEAMREAGIAITVTDLPQGTRIEIILDLISETDV